MTGSYLDTASANDVYESIQEVLSTGGSPSNKHSRCEHRWTVNVGSGSLKRFQAEAWQTLSNDNDDFRFEYSTDGSNFLSLVLVNAYGGDVDSYVVADLPPSVTGTITIRVVDTNRAQGTQFLDTVVRGRAVRSGGAVRGRGASARDGRPYFGSGRRGKVSWTSFGSARRSPGRAVTVTSTEKGLLRTWPTDGPKVLWTAPPGIGFGGPAVSAGKVYLLDRDDNVGDTLRVYDLSNGKELWNFAYAGPGKVEYPHHAAPGMMGIMPETGLCRAE